MALTLIIYYVYRTRLDVAILCTIIGFQVNLALLSNVPQKPVSTMGKSWINRPARELLWVLLLNFGCNKTLRKLHHFRGITPDLLPANLETAVSINRMYPFWVFIPALFWMLLTSLN
jgi:hypothetical protein